MAAEDTDRAAERVRLDLLRRASPAERFALTRALSRTVIELSRRAVRRRVGDEAEALMTSVALAYGDELASRLRAYLAERDP